MTTFPGDLVIAASTGRPLSDRYGAAKLSGDNQSTGENSTLTDQEQLRRAPNSAAGYCGGPQTPGVAQAAETEKRNVSATFRSDRC
jgi:hypothetical protein